MNDVIAISALNSRIKFDKVDVPFSQREIMGDATETGLSRFAGRYLEDYDAYVNSHPKVFEVPFNSTNKWAMVIVCLVIRPSCRLHNDLPFYQVNKFHQSGVLTSYIKGAPERVLAKCTIYVKDGQLLPIDDDFRQNYDAAYNVRLHPIISRFYCLANLHP